jgi:hypothetical protein
VRLRLGLHLLPVLLRICNDDLAAGTFAFKDTHRAWLHIASCTTVGSHRVKRNKGQGSRGWDHSQRVACKRESDGLACRGEPLCFQRQYPASLVEGVAAAMTTTARRPSAHCKQAPRDSDRFACRAPFQANSHYRSMLKGNVAAEPWRMMGVTITFICLLPGLVSTQHWPHDAAKSARLARRAGMQHLGSTCLRSPCGARLAFCFTPATKAFGFSG